MNQYIGDIIPYNYSASNMNILSFKPVGASTQLYAEIGEYNENKIILL